MACTSFYAGVRMTYTGDPNTQNTGSTRDHSVLEPLPRPNPGEWGDAKQIGDPAILNCQTWLAENYERADIVTGIGTPIGITEARLRSAVPGGHRLCAAGQYSGAAHRGGQAAAGNGLRHHRGRRARGRTWPRFGACFGGWPGMAPGDDRRKFQGPAFVSRGAPAHKRQGQTKPQAEAISPNSLCPGRNGARGVVRPRAAPLGARAVRRLGQSDCRPTGPHRRPTLRPHGEVRHFALDGYSPKYFKAI